MGKPIIASPGKRSIFKQVDPDSTGSYSRKEEALPDTQELLAKIDHLQERLYAEGKQSLLIILQGMDSCGKDGTIRHVFRGISPQGCLVASFAEPTPEEQRHDFLWRTHQKNPRQGSDRHPQPFPLRGCAGAPGARHHQPQGSGRALRGDSTRWNDS